MKKVNLNKMISACTVLFFLLLEFKSFAQLPGDDQDGGGLQGDDVPATPIDSPAMIILLLLGVLFVFFYFKKNTIQREN
jgi:hypothetical protein